MCTVHSAQEAAKGTLAHGCVDGEVPDAKLAEFEGSKARAPAKGERSSGKEKKERVKRASPKAQRSKEAALDELPPRNKLLPRSDRSVTAESAQVGARVVRGLDWSFGDADGGQGSVGEITSLGGCPGVPEGWVRVKFPDAKGPQEYAVRVGGMGKFDLFTHA